MSKTIESLKFSMIISVDENGHTTMGEDDDGEPEELEFDISFMAMNSFLLEGEEDLGESVEKMLLLDAEGLSYNKIEDAIDSGLFEMSVDEAQDLLDQGKIVFAVQVDDPEFKMWIIPEGMKKDKVKKELSRLIPDVLTQVCEDCGELQEAIDCGFDEVFYLKF